MKKTVSAHPLKSPTEDPHVAHAHVWMHKRAHDIWREMLDELPGTDASAAGVVRALLENAAAVSIRFDFSQEDFMRTVRSAYETARVTTRQVDAEDES